MCFTQILVKNPINKQTRSIIYKNEERKHTQKKAAPVESVSLQEESKVRAVSFSMTSIRNGRPAKAPGSRIAKGF